MTSYESALTKHGTSVAVICAPLTCEQLTPAIGAVLTGIDLSTPLSRPNLEAIGELLSRHLVLFFPDQAVTPTQQRDFAALFGDLYVHPFYQGPADVPELMILESDGARPAHSERWHNDVTYLAAPPWCAVLYSEEVPALGGDTLWANMYLAYETLSEPLRRLVVELRAVHSFAKNFTPERFAALKMASRREGLYAQHPQVSHPVVRTNATTGRKALFVNEDFTSHIEGLSSRESDALLKLLYEHMAKPQFQVRWRWRAGTVAMWDNRWTQHCAIADYYPLRRRMRRATIIGDRPI
jgi:taurine dioxygenase